MAKKKVTRAISTENTFTDRVILHGYFNLSVYGDWSGTITIQRSFDNGTTWHDVKQTTSNIQEYGFEPEDSQHKVCWPCVKKSMEKEFN